MSLAAIIPLKNELGNVEDMVFGASRIKLLDEIVFIDGNSEDGTYEGLVKFIANHKDKRMLAIKQNLPLGKFEAIKQASRHLSSENILIWDGDNTIDYIDVRETLALYSNFQDNKSVFVVANRLTSEKESNSFRVINLIGNYLFSLLMVPVLNKKLPDVLSGLKIFPRYLLANNDNCDKLLDLDKFGDLTLLSLGRKYGLRFISVPCTYKARTYGKSSIQRWSGGKNLLSVVMHLVTHRCYKNKD